ncbi:MAG: hypothetical protein Q8P18_21465 [Pseudomonadota bacterium]|nr:hypothetical protein [Pseudomonadota bacterium]
MAIGAEPPTAGPAGSFTTYAAGVASINEHSTSASLTFHPLPRALTAL